MHINLAGKKQGKHKLHQSKHCDEKQKKMPKKYIKLLSNISNISHTDPCCNMLQTLDGWRKTIGVILSEKHTPKKTNNAQICSTRLATDKSLLF